MDNLLPGTAQSAMKEKASSYYDFAELDKLRASKPDDKAALTKAAKHFESIFTQMLVTSMRKASEVLESDSVFNSQTSKFYRDMQDKQMVSNIAAQGGLGLTDMIVKQLSGSGEDYKPASILRPDAGLNGMGRVHSAQQNVQQDDKQERVKTSSAQNKTDNDKGSIFDSPANFVKSLLPAAKKALQGTPIQPLMLVAQAALETGWGQKVIKKTDGNSSFNLFGIKADSRWQGEKANVQTLEYRDGVAKKENAFFRAYNSLEDSVKDYVDFLSSDSRYSQALQNGKDPAKYFESLQSAGYATDPEYAKKIVKILNSDYFAGLKE